MKRLIILIALLLSFFNIGLTQHKSKILLLNGYLHVGNGEVKENALIGIEAGEIVLIRNTFAYTYKSEDWDTIIDLRGKHVYPGFIAPNSTLGLTEIDAVRATRDYNEVGSLNPHVRTQIAYNVESKVVSTVRTNGVLLTQATPRGGIISGSSSVMATDGWNWQDATIKYDDGIHLNWPPTVRYRNENDQEKQRETYREKKREIYSFFDMAKAYSELKEPESPDLRFEALRDCFKGDKRVYIHADELQQLIDIIEFSLKYNLPHPVIVGGYDAYLITRQLADAKIPVMLVRLHGLPENDEDPIDLVYRLPFLLKQGGVKFCLQNEGDMEAMNARNIPFLSGSAIAYGLTPEDAVSAISLWSCEIMGIDKRYGSIEKGKSATLFVSDGSALDMKTNNVYLGMIDGKFISTSNFQKDLFNKFQKKYQ